MTVSRMKNAMMNSLSFRIYMAIHEWYMRALETGTSLACDVYLDGETIRTAAVGLNPGEMPGELIVEGATATDYVDDDPADYTPEEFATNCMISHGEIEVEEKRGPGRPEIGPAIQVRLPEDLLAAVDAKAEAENVSRAEMVRTLLDEAISIRRRTVWCSMCAEAFVVPESEIGPSDNDPIEWGEQAIDDYLRKIGHGCYAT